ncbi:hypothetical protein FRB97_007732 [Tulasnella sp. 331]|nr:hypothetical protein FRB97_007732 [Tulasnella sp. 331]
MPPIQKKGAKKIPQGGFTDAANNRQRKANKAGLLVTDELEKAITRCKTKVEKLASECLRGNRKFRDIEFDIIEDRERCLHALNTTDKPKYTPADIRRATDIFVNPEFFVDGATASDISQGALGDCWFLSALAVAGTRNLIEKICVARNEKVGVYGFIFYRDGGWVDVIIDDLLFTKVPRWEALSTREQMLYHSNKSRYDKTARKGSKNLYFAKSRTDNETWVPLIEKAFAKLHGDYASLEGGYTSEGVEDLTGAVSTIMYVQDLLDTDLYWKDELMRVGVDRLFACFTPDLDFVTGDAGDDIPTPAPQTNGLITGHAYGIIKAVEFHDSKFLRLRNPWGQSEWTGRWSDGSKEWNVEWGQELLKALDYEFGDDGEFIMEYCDFLETWAIVERSRLFDDDWVMSSQWLKVTTGNYTNAWNYGDVSYNIKVDKPTPAVIVLAQLDGRYFEEFSGCYRWSLDFTVYPKPAPMEGAEKADSPTGELIAPTQPPPPTEALGSAIHSSFWDRSVKMEVQLPQAGEYVVQVRIDRSLKRDKDWLSENASNWSGRKYARKYTEYVLSQSIATNFDPSSQGVALPLPAETYTDKTLAELELEAIAHIAEHREHKKEVFGPPKKEEETTEESAPEPENTDQPKKFASESVAHDTIPAPDKEDGKAADDVTAKKDAKVDDKRCEGPEGDGEEADGEKGDTEAKEEADGGEESEAVSTENGEGDEEDETEEKAAEEPAEPQHDGYSCNGCRAGNDQDPSNQVIVGLRVYTMKDAPATVTGQLRNGNVIRESVTMSKVL